MLIQELTEEEAERICEYYWQQYNNRFDLMFYDKNEEGPCSHCPFSVSPSLHENVCTKYVMFNPLSDENVAIAKGEVSAK